MSDAALRSQIAKDAALNGLFVDKMLAAVGIPNVQVFYYDYGQKVVIEVSGGGGCFIRFDEKFAKLSDAEAIRTYLLRVTPKRSRDEIFQFCQ